MSLGENVPAEGRLAGKRKVLFEAIQAEPGIHFSGLRRATTIPSGTASHHLSMLQAFGYIDSVYAGPTKRYFPSGMEPQAFSEAAMYARDPVVSDLLAIVEDNPGIRQTDVAMEYGEVPRQTVAHRLNRCVDMGLVRRDRVPGTSTRYWLNGHHGTDNER